MEKCPVDWLSVSFGGPAAQAFGRLEFPLDVARDGVRDGAEGKRELEADVAAEDWVADYRKLI